MGYVSRLFRKFKKEEKYVTIFSSIFWSVLILMIGCYMLWYAEKKYSSGPKIIHQPKAEEKTNNTGKSPEIIEKFDSNSLILVEKEKHKEQVESI